MIKSRLVTEFPQALDPISSPYALNEFTPSTRSLSDENSTLDDTQGIQRRNSRMTVRTGKAVFVGDVGVGKTSIINRFCRDIFELNYKQTIGVDYEMERLWILNVPFNLQIWDTAGQERFKCIASSYYRSSHAIITVFDASDLETLSTCQKWMDEAVDSNATVPLKFLVASKIDLVNENHRPKINEMGKRMANLLGAEYWQLSSKTGENVEIFFRRVAVLIFETTLSNDIKENISRAKHSTNEIKQSGLRTMRLRNESQHSRPAISCASCNA